MPTVYIEKELQCNNQVFVLSHLQCTYKYIKLK